jgi:membrane-bound lytic murein transglycosylase D
MVRACEAKGSYEKIFSEYCEGYFGFASRNFYSEFLAALHVAGKLERNTAIPREKPVHFTEHILPGYIHITDVKRHFNVSGASLEQLNPALRPPVYSGRKLLPKGYPLRLPPQKNIRTLTSSLPRSTFSGNQIKDAVHRVKSGENALRIAARHSVSLKDLLAANNLRHDSKIFAGQKLRIPAAGSASSLKTRRPALLIAADDRNTTTTKSSTTTGSGKKTLPVLSAEQSKIHKTATR